VAKERPVTIVMVDCPHRRRPQEYFFTTKMGLGPREVCDVIELRWPIEVFFRETKQHLGLETAQSRTPLAVERTTAFLFFVGGLVPYWYLAVPEETRQDLAERYLAKPRARSDDRPPSFLTMLRLLRAAIWDHRISTNSYPFSEVGKKAEAMIRCILAAA